MRHPRHHRATNHNCVLTVFPPRPVQFMSFIFNQQQQQKRKSLHRHATHKPQQQPPPAARMQRRSSLVKDSSSPALLHVTGEPMKRKFSITACRRNSSFELPENQFMLTMNISNTETNEQIWYKQDGARFGGSQLTLKFGTNSLYNIYLKTKPAQNFTTLFIGNTELKLTAIEGGAGEFAAVWNTADKQPTKKGTRQDIEFVLTGKEKTLSKKLQIKFYPRTDSHAGWGQKLDQIIWQCAYNDVGNVTVTDEQTI